MSRSAARLQLLALLAVGGLGSEPDGHRLFGAPACPSSSSPWADAAAAPGVALLQHGVASGSAARRQVLDLAQEGAGARVEAVGTRASHCNTPIEAAEHDACPEACPYWAQDMQSEPCHFQCVKGGECGSGSLDGNATIPDKQLKYCRPCRITGCQKCASNGEDRCQECNMGYALDANGACAMSLNGVWFYGIVALLTIVALLISWYVDLRSRPVVNSEGVAEGLTFRSRTKLHMDHDAQGKRRLWPLMTNLLTTQVAGPGLTLAFNFQLAMILWAAMLAICWLCLAWFVDEGFFVLGVREATTPRQFCIVVAWGHETMRRLAKWKVAFVLFAYLATWLFSLCHAVLQRRRFEAIDDATTMGDFVALCKGAPRFDGSADAESLLKGALEEGTGVKLVGVSICWDFGDKAALVEDAMRHSLGLPVLPLLDRFRAAAWAVAARSTLTSASQPGLEPAAYDGSPRSSPPRRALTTPRRSATLSPGHGHLSPGQGHLSPERHGTMTHRLQARARQAVDMVFGFDGVAPVSGEEISTTDIEGMLREIHCSGWAFAVFETEASRDAAVRAAAGGVPCEGQLVELSDVTVEPETVNWANFHGGAAHQPILKLGLGVIIIIIGLILWALLFYFPYAYFVSSFSYVRGTEPSLLAASTFSLLVVGGNQLMYLLCSTVAEKARFFFKDDQEAAYTVLYTLACLLNVCLDLVITGLTCYWTSVGVGAHNYKGDLISELGTLQDVFESYPMQKALGSALLTYAFPSCFLIPFLLEPLFTIILPYHVMKLLVRSRPEVRGLLAEQSLQIFMPYDFGRYADILLNVLLATLALNFPGGFMIAMFGGFIVSHIYIYFLDHYRVLRCVPAFHSASRSLDDWVNLMMILPCSCLAACFVAKSNCHVGLGFPCLRGGALGCRIVGAFLLHALVHWLLLKWLVPYMGRRGHRLSTFTYAEAATRSPVTWFSTNPVHCLRSRFIYKHEPPCGYYTAGKEHLLRPNPALGAYFSGFAAEVEKF